jgi:translocator protein
VNFRELRFDAMIRRRPWLVTAPAVLLLGMASGWLAGSGYGDRWFDALAKPAFMPPGWVFPVAWTILYLLTGAAAGLVVATEPSPARTRALRRFAVQLVLNLAWSPLFFGLHQAPAALGLILVLDLAVLLAIVAMARVRPLAGGLMLPYAAWLALATALNWEIVRLNP